MAYVKYGEYNGGFENGKKNGIGVFTYLNNDIYSGTWKEDKKHGQGTYIVDACKLQGNKYMKVVLTYFK